MENLERSISTVDDSLKCVQSNLVTFSKSMKSLFSKSVICAFADKGKEMTLIRENTKKDACMYVNDILPKCDDLVTSLTNFFDNYLDLSHADWKAGLQNTIKEAEKFQQECEHLIKVHESMLGPIKKREKELDLLVDELQKLTVSYNEKHQQLAERAKTKRDLAVKIEQNENLPPFFDIIAMGMAMEGAEEMKGALALKIQEKMDEAAVDLLKNDMIPALQSFVDGLQGIAGFFSILKAELMTIEKRGKSAPEANYAETHYKLMRSKGISIKDSCLKFHTIVPQVRSDFFAISSEEEDLDFGKLLDVI